MFLYLFLDESAAEACSQSISLAPGENRALPSVKHFEINRDLINITKTKARAFVKVNFAYVVRRSALNWQKSQ